MRWLLSTLLASLALGLMSGTAFAQRFDALVVEPIDDWEFEDTGLMCEAKRRFSDGENALALRIGSFGPSPVWDFTISGGVMQREWDKLEMDVQFGRDEDIRQVTATPYLVDGRIHYRFQLLLNPEPSIADLYGRGPGIMYAFDREREAQIDRIQVDPQWRAPVTFALGSMAEVFERVRTCGEGLLQQWGLDLEAHRTLAGSAYPLNLQDVEFRDLWRDYIDLRDGVTFAMFWIRVLVDEEGNPTGCALQYSNWQAGPAEAVCEWMMQHGEFYPARSAEGYAIPSYFRFSTLHNF